jgi:site-specific recombinase XerD
MLGALNGIAELVSGGHADAMALNWAALRFQHTAAIRAALAERYKPATVNKSLSALRQVLKQAWRLGQMTQEEYARAADLKGIIGETLPAGRALGSGELIALMSTCGNDATPAGARDAAIIAIMYSCGLRRAELVGLDLANYDSEAGELRVLGKRRKERIVPVVNGTVQALADWLTVRGSEPGPLFIPIRRGGHLQHGERLTTEAIWHMLRRRATAAGIKSLSPHDMRRTFVGDLLDAGADIATVQKLAGHANIQTTARYDRRPEAAKRKAAELLHVPYTRRRMV